MLLKSDLLRTFIQTQLGENAEGVSLIGLMKNFSPWYFETFGAAVDYQTRSDFMAALSELLELQKIVGTSDDRDFIVKFKPEGWLKWMRRQQDEAAAAG